MACKRCGTVAKIEQWQEYRCNECGELFCSRCHELISITKLEEVKCPNCNSDHITITCRSLKKDQGRIYTNMMKKGLL